MVAELGNPEPDFRDEARRILEAAQARGLTLRLAGALAFNFHCPAFARLQESLGRFFTDIDFGGYGRQSALIRTLFKNLGYEEDFMVTRLFGTSRLLFYDRHNGRHSDIFLDKLEFCHDVQFKGRLEAEQQTLPLAELLLEKMQIIKINEKDIIDSIMLLREHPLGLGDEETININIITRVCCADWGWWKTLTTNLTRLLEMLPRYHVLTEEDKTVITAQVETLVHLLAESPKSLAWRIRNRVGTRVKWYRDVEELSR